MIEKKFKKKDVKNLRQLSILCIINKIIFVSLTDLCSCILKLEKDFPKIFDSAYLSNALENNQKDFKKLLDRMMEEKLIRESVLGFQITAKGIQTIYASENGKYIDLVKRIKNYNEIKR